QAIVWPTDSTEVAQVVSLAAERGLELAVRGGGHSSAGHSVRDGGILLDLSELKALEIDTGERTAWAQTGLTAGELTTEAARHGLAVGFGDTASVGIGGITLGGGVGYLARKHGLTIDSLLAAELVTADGPTVPPDAGTPPAQTGPPPRRPPPRAVLGHPWRRRQLRGRHPPALPAPSPERRRRRDA